MESPAEIVAEMRRDLKEMRASGNSNSVSTVLNMGGAGFLVGAFLGIGGLAMAYGFHKDAETERIRSAAKMDVMAAERRADMAALTAVQSQVNDHTDDLKGVRAWLKINGETLARLEAENAH